MEPDAGPSTPSARRARWKTIVLLQLVLWPVLHVIIEFGYRAVERARGRGQSTEELETEIRKLLSVSEDFVPVPGQRRIKGKTEAPQRVKILHPYVGYETSGGVPRLDKELVLLKSDGPGGLLSERYDILVVGGSVALAFVSMGKQRLTEILRADPRFRGKRPYYLPYARGGAKEPQQVNWMIWLASLDVHPHAVINIDGFNEVALGNDNAEMGLHPIYPGFQQWSILVDAGMSDSTALETLLDVREQQSELSRVADLVLGKGLYHSHLVARLALDRMSWLRSESVAGFERYSSRIRQQRLPLLHGPWFEKGEDRAVALSVQNWTEASRSLAALCRARGITYLHVLQPAQHDPGSKPLTEREIRQATSPPSYVNGVQLGYPLMRAAGKVLAAEGVGFLDATQVFAKCPQDLYYDGCHFAEEGHRIFAEAIGPAFLALLPEVK
jgi:hypothetical protein